MYFLSPTFPHQIFQTFLSIHSNPATRISPPHHLFHPTLHFKTQINLLHKPPHFLLSNIQNSNFESKPKAPHYLNIPSLSNSLLHTYNSLPHIQPSSLTLNLSIQIWILTLGTSSHHSYTIQLTTLSLHSLTTLFHHMGNSLSPSNIQIQIWISNLGSLPSHHSNSCKLISTLHLTLLSKFGIFLWIFSSHPTMDTLF